MSATSTEMKRRKIVDIDDLMKKREDILKELHTLPSKERNYKDYIRIAMQIKYHTDAKERKRQHDRMKEKVKQMHNDDELRLKHNSYTKERRKARALIAS